MPPKARHIPCPLCRTPTFSSHLRGGICIHCSDARNEYREAAHQEAEGQEVASAEQFLNLFNLISACSDKREELRAEREEQERLKKEEQKISLVQREIASRELARRSLLHFVERRVANYKTAWVHELVTSQLEEFLQEVVEQKSPRMMLPICPRAGKSELASVSFPAWALGKYPHLRFILASHSNDLPMIFSRQIRECLMSPDYRELFPHGAKLSPDDASVKSWTSVQGGGIRTFGVGSNVLGFGADILIIDDPIASVADADTPEALEKLWAWFSSVAYSRLQPGGGILVIQQRMAYEDLVGKLMKRQAEEELRISELHKEVQELSVQPQTEETVKELVAREEEVEELEASIDRWRVVEYPALATSDEYYDHTAGQIMRLPPGSTADPRWKALRKRGEALDPRRYSRSYLLKIKRNNPRMFATMYMLSPTLDEGAYFSHPDFLRHVSHPKLESMHCFCAWDLAIGVKQTNDYTVGVAGGIDCNGKLWLLDLVRGRFGDVRDIADRVIDMHTKWGASQTGIEHTHVAMALKPILKTRMQERRQYIVLAEGKEKLVATSDKAVRARSLQGLCRGGKFSVPEGEIYDEFIGELTRFDGRGTSGHDDCVDAASWLAILALRTAPPRNPREDLRQKSAEAYQSWMDELLEELGPTDGETFMCR